jgi:hypothetical protein
MRKVSLNFRDALHTASNASSPDQVSVGEVGRWDRAKHRTDILQRPRMTSVHSQWLGCGTCKVQWGNEDTFHSFGLTLDVRTHSTTLHHRMIPLSLLLAFRNEPSSGFPLFSMRCSHPLPRLVVKLSLSILPSDVRITSDCCCGHQIIAQHGSLPEMRKDQVTDLVEVLEGRTASAACKVVPNRGKACHLSGGRRSTMDETLPIPPRLLR